MGIFYPGGVLKNSFLDSLLMAININFVINFFNKDLYKSKYFIKTKKVR